MEQYRIINDFNNDKYRCLLDIVATSCSAFSLTTFKSYHKKNLSSSYFDVLETLRPHAIDSLHFEFPRHYEKGQKFHLFRMNNETLNLLKNINGLYEWIPPSLPEDLSFYRGKRVWLSTVSHEQFCFLHSNDEKDLKAFDMAGFNLIELT